MKSDKYKFRIWYWAIEDWLKRKSIYDMTKEIVKLLAIAVISVSITTMILILIYA